MTNAVDRLFDQILTEIGGAGIEDVPDWPDVPLEEDDYDIMDRSPDLDESSLFPIRDVLDRERAIDILIDGGFPPVGVRAVQR